MATTTAGWLREFLRERNLDKPDGRPLFMYRTSAAELASLRDLVSETQPGSSHDCGAFCLYAAEWWRRHGEGLTFKGLLESLDWGFSYTELYGEIERGLSYWGRELRIVRAQGRSWRDFVGSLSREGGLPLQLLLGSQSSIRRFFRQLLQIQSSGVEVSVAWAELAAVELPKAWRHPDIYELAAALVSHIWQLRKSVAHAERPVLELDRIQPGWQLRLPILVDSEVASALVRGLVEDAQQIATSGRLGLTVETRLVSRNGEWCLQRVLDPPRRMQPREVWKLLDLNPEADDNPRRVRLLVDDGSGPRPFAVATQWKTDDVFELLPLVEGALVSASTTELVVLADTISESFAAKLLRGGERLDSGPWVFVADGQEEGTDNWKLVAQGSARVRARNVLIALPPKVFSPISGTEQHGQLITPKGVRSLVRVTSGRVHINDPESGQRYFVEASASEDEAQSYRFEGALFGEELRPPVWQGVPRVYEEPMFGVRREVHARDLEWRPKHGGHSWERLSDACRGHVEIRLRRGEATLFVRSALVVPASTSSEMRPTTASDTAELTLEGTQASRGLLLPAPGFEAVSLADSGNLAWSVTSRDDSPARVQVQLHWTGARSMKLWLPFPKVGIRFIDSAGRVLPNDATVALDHLAGCRVEALLPRQEPHPLVEATLKSATDRPRGFVSESNFAHKLRLLSKRGAPPIRRFALDLARLVEDAGLRLASTTELNAFVRLEIGTRAGKTRLNVRRFPLAMMVNSERSDVIVLRDKSETFVDDLVGKMSVHRIPIQQPNAQLVSMQASAAGWAIGSVEDSAETWLVIGTEAGRCCARPVIWRLPGDSGPAPENLDAILTLADAVKVGWKHIRLAAISKILDELIADPFHLEWDHLTPFLSSLATLPATTYDVLDVAVQKPTLCVYTLVALSPTVGIQPIWAALEQLSFAWKLVPVNAWIAGFRLWWFRTETDIANLDEALQSIIIEAARTQIRNTLSALEARLHGFTIVRELIERALLGSESGQYMNLAAYPGGIGRQALLESRDEAQMNLFRTHADERSWPSFQATRDLPEKFANEVPDSFRPLWTFANKLRDKTLIVTYAPVLAAIAAACGLKLNPEQIFALRQLEAFDNTWFDHCYEASLAAAIGILLETNPGAFR